MPIPLLELDDRKFNDLAEELQSLIPRHAPGWTDHNISDPGVMLIELFAWLSEAMLYRVNRVPEAGTVRLLELLGARFAAARPLLLKVRFAPLNAEDEYTLPAGSLLRAMSSISDPGIVFETLEPVDLRPGSTSQPVHIRQTTPVLAQEIGVGSGQVNQLVEIPGLPIATPAFPFPQHARLMVKTGDAEETWTFVPNLLGSAFDAAHFTIRARTNVISFGDGVHGRIPPAGAVLTLIYRYAEDGEIHTCGEEVGVSSEKPAQSFRLTQPFLPLDLQPLDDLTPQLWVDGQPWRYQPSFLAMQRGAAEFTVEPKRNAVRFGDGDHGRPPPEWASLTLSYRHTIGAQDAPDVGAFFVAVSGAAQRYLRLHTCRMVDAGSDPTSLDEAREQVYAILQPHWRAITDEDVAEIVAQRFPEIARVYTLPGYDLSAARLYELGATAQAQGLLGHLGVVVMPQAATTWTMPPEIRQILGFSPDGRRMVAQIEKKRSVILWDLNDLGRIRSVEILTSYMHVSAAKFSADSRRVAAISHRGVAWLWDAVSGERLALLSSRAPVQEMVFSPDNSLIAVACQDRFVRVYDAGVGKLHRELLLPATAQRIRFSPDSQFLVTVNAAAQQRATNTGGDASLWRLADGVEVRRFAGVGAVDAVFLAAAGRRLAIHNQDGGAGLWSTRTGTRVADLAAESPVTALRVSSDGALVAAGHEDGQVRVWSAQQATQLAALPSGGEIADVAIGAGNRRLLAVCHDAEDAWRLRWWRLHRGQARLIRDEALPKASSAPILDADGDQLILADGSLVHVWDVAEARQRTTLYVDWMGTSTLWLSHPPGRYVFVVPPHRNGYSGNLQRLNASHVTEVEQFLAERRLVAGHTTVMGPIYADVDITARVIAGYSVKSSERLQRDIADALRRFFHPLQGGPDGAGWTPGRAVYESEIYQVIENVEGVDHVDYLAITPETYDTAPYRMVRCECDITVSKEESG